MTQKPNGFTLVELSVVLVIIGLLAGGILVGKDLIHSAEIRAVIAQVEKYNTAVKAFQLKYNGLPGDLLNAAQAGLFAITNADMRGRGDGNGLIQGFSGGNPCIMPCADYVAYGETVLFWRHLSEAGLIGGSYGSTIDAATGAPSLAPLNTLAAINSLLPLQKIGSHAFFRIVDRKDFKNYFMLYGLDQVAPDGATAMTNACGGAGSACEGVTPFEAYRIDMKMDDGLPLSGGVQAAGGSAWTPIGVLDPTWNDPPAVGWCTSGAIPNNVVYSVTPASVGDVPACGLHFAFN